MEVIKWILAIAIAWICLPIIFLVAGYVVFAILFIVPIMIFVTWIKGLMD